MWILIYKHHTTNEIRLVEESDPNELMLQSNQWRLVGKTKFGLYDVDSVAIREKAPCLYPLPDGRRCLECETCQPAQVS